MYKLLRNKKTQKRIWIVLCIVILPAFILWGAGSVLRSQKKDTPGVKIFGKRISDLDFQDSLEAIRTQAIMQFGDAYPEMQKFMNFKAQALERLILLYEARRRKIKISDQELINFIQKLPFFNNKGQFDNRAYSYMLQYVFHAQPRLFEEQTRQNMIIERLFDAVTKNSSVTEDETKEAYKKENEKVSIYYIASIYSEFAKEVAAKDEELKEYFTKNSISFKQPLSFNLEYISLLTETKKNEIAARLEKKEDFNKILKDESLPLKETGLFSQMDPIPGIGWSPEITSAISKLKTGEVSMPIAVDKTYYIVRLKEKKDPYIPEFDKIKDKVKDAVVKEKTQNLAKEKIEKCLTLLKEMAKNNPKALDFDKAAKETGLKSASTDLFKFGSYIESIGASDEFFNTARNLKDDEFSPIIATPSGFYIIRLKIKMAIDEKLYQKEKDTFKTRLLEQKKQENFAKFYEELKRKALGM